MPPPTDDLPFNDQQLIDLRKAVTAVEGDGNNFDRLCFALLCTAQIFLNSVIEQRVGKI